MRRTFKTILAGLMIWSATAMPASAQDWMDATHLFDDEARWLADNALKETKSEYLLRTRGMVMMADSKPAEVGDEIVFNTINTVEKKPEKTPAVLKKIGKHCYVFVEKGKILSEATLERTITIFDEKIYPTSNSVFGSEWKPGIDNDKRITLLFLDIKDEYQPNDPQKGGYIGGYFYPGDEYNKEQNPQSNEREMLYLDINPADPNREDYFGIVAHEFQHMIHWHNDPKEHAWVNESMSQLSAFLNGFNHPSQVFSFIKNPDNNLCAWSQDTMIANYGQVYLFAYYMMTHAVAGGETERNAFVRDLVACKEHGSDGYEKTLKAHGGKRSFAQYFDAFNVANHLNNRELDSERHGPKPRHKDEVADINNPERAPGLYGYDRNLGKLKLEPLMTHKSAPFTGKGTIKCWSSRAVTFDISKATGRIEVAFAGQRQVAEKYSTDWSVAAVLIDSSNKVKPELEWLKLKDCKGELKLAATAGKHDTLMLVFVNRGPEGGEIELAFAQATTPADFAYSVGVFMKAPSSARVASARRSTVKPMTTARPARVVRSSLEEMVARKPVTEQMAGMLSDGSGVSAAISDSAVNNEFENLKNEETMLFESIQADVLNGELATLNEFATIWKDAGDLARQNLSGLRTRLVDFLRFESMQNSRNDFDKYITEFTN